MRRDNGELHNSKKSRRWRLTGVEVAVSMALTLHSVVGRRTIASVDGRTVEVAGTG
jgi:hypothetical protein